MTQHSTTLTRRRVLAQGAASGVALLAPWPSLRASTSGPTLSSALTDTQRQGIGVWDVRAYDYVAEEFFLSGVANVYEPVCMADAWTVDSRDVTRDFAVRKFEREVLRADVPYTTRLIVYKPREPRRFSGNAIVETLHPNGGGKGLVWESIHRYFLSRGDAYIAVQHPVTIAGLKAAAAARYGVLEVADPTQLWGMLKGTGTLLKGGGDSTPLRGYALKHLLLTGYSFTGVATASFANYHHQESTLAGRSVFDGYLPFADSQYVKPLNVPVIRLNTQSDFDSYGGLGNRRPDDARYRHYEVAGASHATTPTPADAAKAPAAGLVSTPKGQPNLTADSCMAGFPPGSRLNDFPLYLVEEAVFERMFDWLETGVEPPPSLRIETDGAGALRTDRWGNALGGVRYPELSVPVARYGVGSKGFCLLYGYTTPFDAATCRSLYGGVDRYIASVKSAAKELVAGKLVRAASVQELVTLALGRAAF